MKKMAFEAAVLLGLGLVLGLIRPLFPNAISPLGKWPTEETSAEDAYSMMAKPGDPSFISLATVIEAHKNGEAVFLDARANKDFVAGRIPGARSLPYYELDRYHASALQGLRPESPLIVYCEGIGCELSFFLGRELQTAGYKNVHIFYGGYPEWQEAGLPVEHE